MLKELNQRLQSSLPTPPAALGYALDRPVLEGVVYPQQQINALPYFLKRMGSDAKSSRSFLRNNRVGRFTDLEAGQMVYLIPVSASGSFAIHPDY